MTDPVVVHHAKPLLAKDKRVIRHPHHNDEDVMYAGSE